MRSAWTGVADSVLLNAITAGISRRGLLAAGLVTADQFELARREQQRNGGQLARIFVHLGFVTPETLAEFLGRQAGTEAVNLNRV